MAVTGEAALMQRAAAGLSTVCARMLCERRGRVTGARVLLLIGAGNNGGDALWAGWRLARRGARVTALLTSERTHPNGLAALLGVGAEAVPLWSVTDRAETLRIVRALLALGPDLVVDGLVGLGGAPGLREPAATVVAELPTDLPVVAVDLPSGVDPDTGETPASHVRAEATVTFGAHKPCLLLPPGDRAAGTVHLVDLGLGPYLPDSAAVARLGPADVGRLWPVPGPETDKYRRGVLGVVAGSADYPGAAVLVCDAAVGSGAGMVRYFGPAEAADLVRRSVPEAVPGPGRVQAWVLGPGIVPGAVDGQTEAVAEALRSGLPAVVDAGALDLLSADANLRSLLGPHTILTPHAGELARLLTAWDGDGTVTREQVEARPRWHLRRAVEMTGAVVLIKGATTLVGGPDGTVRSQAEGTPWLATAGAGDVLAGVIGTLLSAGLPAADAGAVAASVHGWAATTASRRVGRASGGPERETFRTGNGDRPGTGSRRTSIGGPLTARNVVNQLPSVIELWLTDDSTRADPRRRTKI
jgi:hydroxyethylthiazole kinase-like uncharacterized protein yjeF